MLIRIQTELSSVKTLGGVNILLRKSQDPKSFEIAFYISIPKFRTLGSIIKSFEIFVEGPLKALLYRFLLKWQIFTNKTFDKFYLFWHCVLITSVGTIAFEIGEYEQFLLIFPILADFSWKYLGKYLTYRWKTYTVDFVSSSFLHAVTYKNISERIV